MAKYDIETHNVVFSEDFRFLRVYNNSSIKDIIAEYPLSGGATSVEVSSDGFDYKIRSTGTMEKVTLKVDVAAGAEIFIGQGRFGGVGTMDLLTLRPGGGMRTNLNLDLQSSKLRLQHVPGNYALRAFVSDPSCLTFTTL